MDINSAQLPFIDGSRLIKIEARVADAFFPEGKGKADNIYGNVCLTEPWTRSVIPFCWS